MSLAKRAILVRHSASLATGLFGSLLLAACGSSHPVANSAGSSSGGGPSASVCGQPLPVVIANSGRKLMPLGRLSTVGNFPTGGRLSPDGRYYWSVSAGHGQNDVHIVELASGKVTQVLPLSGAYGEMVFAPDGNATIVNVGAYPYAVGFERSGRYAYISNA